MSAHIYYIELSHRKNRLDVFKSEMEGIIPKNKIRVTNFAINKFDSQNKFVEKRRFVLFRRRIGGVFGDHKEDVWTRSTVDGKYV